MIRLPTLRLPQILPAAVGTAIVLLVAGLTHLSAVLLLPDVATRDAYDLLAARGIGTKGMAMFPSARPGDTLIPFRDPATIQGICFFDLTKAPVRLKTTTEPGRFLALSFRTREGTIFYSMTDRAALRGKIDIRLVTGAQLEAITDGDDEGQELPEELRLEAPRVRGLIVATALVARPSERAETEARIKAIGCTPEPLPPPPPS